VHEVLNEILGGPRDTLMVFNKVDALDDRNLVNVLLRHHPRAQFTSARSGEGLEMLRRAVLTHLEGRMVEVELVLQRRAPQVLAFCYREGRVRRQDQDDGGKPRLWVCFPDVAFRKLLKAHRGDFDMWPVSSGSEEP